MKSVTLWLIVAALVIGLTRFLVPHHPISLQGTHTAIMFGMLGGMVASWCVSRKSLYLLLALALVVVEVTAFFSR